MKFKPLTLISLFFVLMLPQLSWSYDKKCHSNYEKSLIGKTSLPSELTSLLDSATQVRVQNIFHEKKYMEAAWELRESGFPDLANIIERQLGSYLETASIISKAPLGAGTTGALLIKLEGNMFAIFKTDEHIYADVNHEIAAYKVDQIFGTGLVPVTTDRTIDGKRGSIQYYLNSPYLVGNNSLPLTGDILFFDWLINNPDRHGKNILVHSLNNKIKAIDHGLAFNSEHPYTFFRPFYPLLQQEALIKYPYLYPNLQNMIPPILVENLKNLLSPREIEALIKRRKEILEKMEEAINYKLDTSKARDVDF